MMDAKQRYHEGSDFQFKHEEICLGAPSSYSLLHDPKHLLFVLSRYKFCAKMLEGKTNVIEIGAGDGLGLPIMSKAVGHLYCVDWDIRHQDSIRRRMLHQFKNVTLLHLDINEEAPKIKADAVFWIDVIEHLEPANEDRVMERIVSCLLDNGVLITGTPNATAAHLASPCSAVQHINLKTMEGLRDLMKRYFDNVFIFGMNDEVLHTGYAPMCHYIWTVACGRKQTVKRFS